MAFKKGDIVGRRSYNSDILFKIVDVQKKNVLLKGIDFRLRADAPTEDLVTPSANKVKEYKVRIQEMETRCMRNIFKRRSLEMEKMRGRGSKMESFIELPGTVLHIDGDREYLAECLRAYVTLGLSARGEYCPEAEQPEAVEALLKKYQPDMVVLTGHDAYLKGRGEKFESIKAYRNSENFIEAVKAARRHEAAKDDLIIFAGGCQSHYEGLIAAGANYASSPQRILIHCLDPVFIMEKICYTSINRTVNVQDAIESTISGFDGLGGIETRGKFRLGMPKSPY